MGPASKNQEFSEVSFRQCGQQDKLKSITVKSLKQAGIANQQQPSVAKIENQIKINTPQKSETQEISSR